MQLVFYKIWASQNKLKELQLGLKADPHLQIHNVSYCSIMKQILIAYINIGNKGYPKEANEYLTFVKKRIQDEFGNEVEVRVIPTNGEDRIEYKTMFDMDFKPDEAFQSINEKFSKMSDHLGKTFSNFAKKLENAFDAYKKG